MVQASMKRQNPALLLLQQQLYLAYQKCLFSIRSLWTIQLGPSYSISSETVVPSFMAPGTSSVEDSFSTDGVGGMVSG